MPAISADPASLPKVSLPPAGSHPRPVRSVTTSPSGFEGEGFPVRRAFAGVELEALDPFIHMDQMGPVVYPPGGALGTPWHPHRGFETVTYVIDGTFLHQDSHGGGGVISDGDTQWMTAGSGLLHIETPPEELVRSGGPFHGIQLWVNLPSSAKMLPPAYQGIAADHVLLLSSADERALVRLIAGAVGEHHGPGSTHTPIVMIHASIAAGGELVLPWDPSFNALAYALEGRGSVGSDGVAFAAGQLAVFGEGGSIIVRAAADAPLEVLLLGGEPIREPVAMSGPFVMNTRAELVQAFDDFQAGLLGTVPADGIQPFRV